MSTTSGFIVGLLTAASVTVVLSGKISGGLEQALQEVALPVPSVPPLPESAPPPVQLEPVREGASQSAAGPQQPVPPAPTLEQRWADYAAAADDTVIGEFPWRACFRRAAAAHTVPESLLLAVASGESNFDVSARSDKDAVGLMQIRWPDTARHLGVRREADLYDPCTNVDAGARYLAELLGRFDNNLHLAVAAYNYGPGRIVHGKVPEGARWYSQYIYQHLQQVLGEQQLAAGKQIAPTSEGSPGHLVLMRFNHSRRARDFLVFLRGEIPGLELQQRSETPGQHEVVLSYHSENERLRALKAISASGLAINHSNSPDKLSL